MLSLKLIWQQCSESHATLGDVRPRQSNSPRWQSHKGSSFGRFPQTVQGFLGTYTSASGFHARMPIQIETQTPLRLETLDGIAATANERSEAASIPKCRKPQSQTPCIQNILVCIDPMARNLAGHGPKPTIPKPNSIAPSTFSATTP